MMLALQETGHSNHLSAVVAPIDTVTGALPMAAVAEHRQPAAAARRSGRRLALQSWQVPVVPWVVAPGRALLPAALQ